jgi:hypothetical protein
MSTYRYYQCLETSIYSDKNTKHQHMKLLPNEQKLITSNKDKVILTDHRIQMTEKEWGESYRISIFLEDISSIETKYKSYIGLVVFGILIILVSIFLAGQLRVPELIIVGLAMGIVLFITWFFSRQHIISIMSGGGSTLNFVTQGMNEDAINDFVYRVSLAKQERLKLLHKI